MKYFMLAAVSVFSLNAQAISFITEENVQQALGADKVIEISRYTVQEKLVVKGSDCEADTFSRSGRTYIVKKGNYTFLAVTSSGLEDLKNCGEL